MKKFVVVIVLACIVAVCAEHHLNLTEEQKARVRTYATECREKEGVTKEAVQALRGGHFDAVDYKTKCFTNCFFEKFGFFTNGVLHADVVYSKLTPLIGTDSYHTLSEKCNSVHGADNCETAYQFYKCYYENHASVL